MVLAPPVLVLGLAVAFGLPAIGFYRKSHSPDAFDWSFLRRSLLWNWGILTGFIALATIAGHPSDLGFRIPTVGVLVDGLLYGFIAFGGTMVLVGLVLRHTGGPTIDAATRTVFEQPPFRRLLVAATGAIVETTIFYGFVVEALLAFNAGPWIAGTGAIVGVLLMRARWSTQNALQWLPGAVVLAGITLWTDTVLVAVLIRLGYDALTLLSGDTNDYILDET